MFIYQWLIILFIVWCVFTILSGIILSSLMTGFIFITFILFTINHSEIIISRRKDKK